MVALLAQIVREKQSADTRRSGRRALRLRVTASLAENSADAVIHNLSEDGLLLETAISLQIGDRVGVELPHSRGATGIVVWSRDDLYGCKFEREISRAAVSAALLLSPARLPLLEVGQIIPPAEPAEPSPFTGRDAAVTERRTAHGLLALGLVLALAAAAFFIWALLSLPFAST